MPESDFTYVTYIAAPIERVWQALTDGEVTARYFFGRRIESDWRAGSQVLYLGEGGRVDVQGSVIVCDEPRLLSFTWRVVFLDEYRGLPEAVVTFQLDPVGDLVCLTLTERQSETVDEKYRDGGRRGWPYVLSGLKTLLETGSPLPLPPRG